jgi:hypothetical protein
MEILGAEDLTGGLRAAAVLAGCDHKTVAHYVALREAGLAPGERVPRGGLIDEFRARSRSGWTARRGGSARRWCTTSCMRGASPARNAPRGGRWRQRRSPGGPGTGGCFGHGSPSPDCGCSLTGATARRSIRAARCCFVGGWPGRGFGWCSYLGPHPAQPAGMPGQHVARVWWRADVCAHRQREDGYGGTYRAGALGHRRRCRGMAGGSRRHGVARIRAKMADAVALAKLHGSAAVDQALGTAALACRFADGDLAAILTLWC